MGFSSEKRKFFIDALGEERVRQLEAHLPALAKALAEYGINFKEVTEMVEPVLSFADAEAEKLLGVFGALVGNIVHSEMTHQQKVAKLEALLADLKVRIGAVKTATGARALVNDLLERGARSGPSPNDTQAAKAVRETGAPASGIVADLLERGAVQG